MHLLLRVLVSLYLPQPANDHREDILQELLGQLLNIMIQNQWLRVIELRVVQ